ncbi:MAG: KH domain-containing protein [Thermoproteota archaeon]
MSRLQALINELASQLTEKAGRAPDREPDTEIFFEVHSTWDDFAQSLYEALVNSGLVGEYEGQGYSYLLNFMPYAASTIQLKWWGPKKHQRLTEIKHAIRQLIARAKDVFWEDIKSSQIKRELEILRAEALEKAREPLKELLSFYTGRVPAKVFVTLASADYDYDPESRTITLSGLPDDYKGHIIGKGGVKIREFEQQSGYKLKLL